MSDSLQPHRLQHTRLPCPSLSPKICSNSRPLCPWCHPTISLCFLFLFLPSIFPSIRIFPNEQALCITWPKYWSFSFGISPSNEYLELIFFRIYFWSPCSPRDSQEFSPTPLFKSINSLALNLLCDTTLISIHDYWKNHSFDYMDLCQQSDVSAFPLLINNTMSRFVIAFLPRNKCLISFCNHCPQWFWSHQKENLSLFPLFPLLFAMKWWDQMPWSSFVENWI